MAYYIIDQAWFHVIISKQITCGIFYGSHDEKSVCIMHMQTVKILFGLHCALKVAVRSVSIIWNLDRLISQGIFSHDVTYIK